MKTYGERLAAEIVAITKDRALSEAMLAALLDTAHFAGKVEQLDASVRRRVTPDELRQTGAL